MASRGLRHLLQRVLFPETIAATRGPDTANVARERLAIVLAQQRSDGIRGINLQDMQKDILGVVAKYMKVDMSDVTIGVRKLDSRLEIMEVQVAIGQHQLPLSA
uniref:Mitochondrial MinE n=1 Tax=Malawimonas californiana TaxID=221722 RepID=A0A0E3X182_MALCL|nr:mitochondrial MinE [Malawimonas californiana]